MINWWGLIIWPILYMIIKLATRKHVGQTIDHVVKKKSLKETTKVNGNKYNDML